jgi:Phage integrase family
LPRPQAWGAEQRDVVLQGLQERVDGIWEPKDDTGSLTGKKVGNRITAHECRHTCASWLDAAGVRPVIVSQLMGHAAPVRQIGAAQITQERYTHVLPGELERGRERFDRWLADAAAARDEPLART